MPDDYSADTQTTGAVEVGGSTTGNIESANDFDWFAVELVAGRTYVIDLEGSDTGGGTLSNPVLRGLYLDGNGGRISGTQTNDGGDGRNAQLTYTATTTGTHYIAARGYGSRTGTYTVRVTETTTDPTETTTDPTETVTDLGDITDLGRPRFPDASFSGAAGEVLSWSFTLTEAKSVGLGLRRLDADADLVLEDAEGNELANSRTTGTANEWLEETLLAGTYYVRVEARASGANDFKLRYGVEAPDAERVTELEAQAAAAQAEEDALRQALEQTQGRALETTNVDVRAQSREGRSLEPDPPIAEQQQADDYAATTDTTGTVTVGGSATGNVEYDGDRDWFAVDLVAGKSYRVELRGGATENGTLWDPYLRGIYDGDGNRIEGTTNDDGDRPDSLVAYTPTTSGTFYIAAGADGSRTGTYTLSVAEFTDDYGASTGTTGTVTVGGSATGDVEAGGDRDWFAVELVAGTTYVIRLEGRSTKQGTLVDPSLYGIYDAEGNRIEDTTNDDADRTRNSKVVYTATTSGTFYIAAGGHNNAWDGTYRLSVQGFEDDYLASTDTTGVVTVGGSVTGEVEHGGENGDRDWFAVELEAGATYIIDLEGSGTNQGTMRDPYLHGIYDGDGNRIESTSNDDGGEGSNSRVVYYAGTSGTYYIAAGGDELHSATGTYKLSVTKREDDYLSSTGTTGTVTVDGDVTGEVEHGGDRDWFAVELVAGTIYRIKLEGSQNDNGTLRDPYLYGIYDGDGEKIDMTWNDDDGYFSRNSEVTYEPNKSGTFYISAGGDKDWKGTYRLSVSVFVPAEDDYSGHTDTTGTVAVDGSVTGNIQYPGDRDWFAVELTAGTTYGVKLEGRSTNQGTVNDTYLYGIYDGDGKLIEGTTDDDSGVIWNSETAYKPSTSGTYYISAGGLGRRTGTYRLSVDADDYTAATDTTGAVTVGGSATGKLEFEGDRDWFAVELVAGTTYRIDVKGNVRDDYGGTLGNPHAVLRNGSGDHLASDDNGGERVNSRMEVVLDTNGTYYVEVSDVGGRGTYTVFVQEVDDAI